MKLLGYWILIRRLLCAQTCLINDDFAESSCDGKICPVNQEQNLSGMRILLII